MALPQWAMAHFGSRVAASTKVCSDSLYWKEWSSATPFSMVGCTAPEQVVGKFTWPRRSGSAESDRKADRRKSAPNSSAMAAFKRRVSRIWDLLLVIENDSTSDRGVVRASGARKRAFRDLRSCASLYEPASSRFREILDAFAEDRPFSRDETSKKRGLEVRREDNHSRMRFPLSEATLLQLGTERYFDAGEGAKAV